jgi:hypothetical protein
MHQSALTSEYQIPIIEQSDSHHLKRQISTIPASLQRVTGHYRVVAENLVTSYSHFVNISIN